MSTTRSTGSTTRSTHPTRRPLLRRGLAALAGAGLLAGGLAGCGSSDSSAQPSASATQASTAANGDVIDGADVRFATDMIPHHAQALQMVDMTRGRPLDPAVQKLAEQIQAAQSPEIQTMTGWLDSWGEKVPSTSRDHAHSHDMGDMGGMGGMDMGGSESADGASMTGMMSSQDMADLEKASDADFQSMWLRMMIEHHQGAVDMARTEVRDGRYGPAIDLARSIISSQEAQIATMKKLLASS